MYSVFVEVWGGEFLDDGKFGKIERFSEPWPSEAILLSVELVELLVSKQRLQEVAVKDAKQIASLMHSITINGLQQPIEVSYSTTSVYLKDGHHRYLAFKRLGYEKIPTLVAPGARGSIGISSERFLEWYFNEQR